ncbi:MAG TPA: hypothetical protein VM847_21910 [Tahibacter sp.]|nr:hypothetical protein [Tahibacter sp.]
MKMHWRGMILGLCLSPAAWSADLTEAQIRQIIRDEVRAQLASQRETGAPAPTVESVSVALGAGKRADEGWFPIHTGRAASTAPVFRTEAAAQAPAEPELPLQSSDDADVERALSTAALQSPPDALTSAAGVATADNPVRQDNSAVELLATSEGTVATITLGTKAKPVYSPASHRISKQGWSFKATTPIDKDSGRATFASLTGPGNGLTLGVSSTYSSTPAKSADQPTGWSRVFNVESEIGYNDFDYYTSLTHKQTDREMRWMAGGTIATSSPERFAYFGAGFRVQRGYRSQTARIVCPQSADDTFDCVQGSFGPPRRGYQRIAYAEARSAVLGRPFSLRVSHDFASDRSSVDLPIYLLRNAASRFTGGLRLGWDSDNDFVAGVFVGKEFSLE